jgi:hypothetical protein
VSRVHVGALLANGVNGRPGQQRSPRQQPQSRHTHYYFATRLRSVCFYSSMPHCSTACLMRRNPSVQPLLAPNFFVTCNTQYDATLLVCKHHHCCYYIILYYIILYYIILYYINTTTTTSSVFFVSLAVSLVLTVTAY